MAIKVGNQIMESHELDLRTKGFYLNTLGLAYLEHSAFLEARDCFEQTMLIAPSAVVRQNLGLALLGLGELEEAEFLLWEAMKDTQELLFRKESDVGTYDNTMSLSEDFIFKTLCEDYGNRWLNLLDLYLQKECLDDANKAYRIAFEYYGKVDSLGRLPKFSELYFKKAKLEQALGHHDSTMLFLAKAINLAAPQLAIAEEGEKLSLIGSFKDGLEVLAFRAQVLTEQGKLNKALEDVMLLNRLVTQSRRTYQSSLSKYFLIQKVVPVYELGIQLNRQLYTQTGEEQYLEQAYALNAHNKAILLLESLKSERAMSFAGLPAEVQEQERELCDAVLDQQSLLYQAYQKGQDIDSLQSMVFGQEQKYYQFVQQLERDYPAYYELKYTADQPPSINQVQDKLEHDQALLEYFIGQDSIYIFLMDGETLRVYCKPKSEDFVDSVTLFRELLTNGIEKDCEQTYIRLGRYFYELLLAAPLASLDKKKKRLVVVPDGLLNFLSFEAFVYKHLERMRGADGFLIEKYAFSYAYSSKLLRANEYYSRSATKGFAGFGMEYDDYTMDYLKELKYGDLNYVDTTLMLPCGQLKDTTRYYWGKLLYSDDEVRDIAALADGDIWLNEQATKQQFIDNAEGYNILHLAMHDTYDLELPMNSSLIFSRTDSSDIFLRAVDIYNMKLDGDMAVLSACNTAYGRLQAGEGPMTLARAFHYAGIPAVVASLWSIPDNSTSKIMKLFYEHLDEGGPKDVALQQAKLAYLTSNELSSPNSRQPPYWAATVVIGDVVPIPVSPRFHWWLVLVAGFLVVGYWGISSIQRLRETS